MIVLHVQFWLTPYRCATLAGLHEGVKSLVEGGAPPGFLIIDDGWQCTDVDEPLRQVGLGFLGHLMASSMLPVGASCCWHRYSVRLLCMRLLCTRFAVAKATG